MLFNDLCPTPEELEKWSKEQNKAVLTPPSPIQYLQQRVEQLVQQQANLENRIHFLEARIVTLQQNQSYTANFIAGTVDKGNNR